MSSKLWRAKMVIFTPEIMGDEGGSAHCAVMGSVFGITGRSCAAGSSPGRRGGIDAA